MTPPETDLVGTSANGSKSRAALSCPAITVLTQRRDFLRASRGKRVATSGFILQMYKRPEGEAEGVRVGYTCSKKVGNAVERNRAKRRLREIARSVLSAHGVEGHDYVLVGRNTSTATLPFSVLLDDLAKALKILHGVRK